MFVNFSEETRHILKQAEREKEELNHPYVGSEHLFLSVLKSGRLVDVLKKHKITYKKFKEKLVSLVGVGSKKNDFTLYTPLLKRVLENAVIEAREENNRVVNPEIIIISILDEEDGVAYSILKSFKVNIDRLYYDLKIKKNVKNNKKKKLLLDELGTNLTKLARENKLDPVIGRDDEINKATQILLRRKKNNPILIGPAGVGKTAIVEGIANLMVKGNCPEFLKGKKIISLNIFSLVSGTKYRGEFEEKMKTLIKELEENQDIILFIDEIHTMVGAGGAEGAIDASNIFKPALARGLIRIIGATTLDEYKKYIEPDAALARRFQSVIVEEPDKESVVKILTEIKPLYEKYHNIKISNNLIKEIVNMSEKYLTNRFEPDRSIDVLDEVCAKVSVLESESEKVHKNIQNKINKIKESKIKAISQGNFKEAYELKTMENDLVIKLDKHSIKGKEVTKKDILEVIKNKGNIRVLGIDKERKLFYEKLEKKLNNCVIGQKKAINNLITSLKRKELTKTKRCYSILLVGPKSVGKTLLAKTFLENTARKTDVIKIDLSEYKEYHTITKLIGTTAGYVGYDNKSHLFEKVRTCPSSALLIDNFGEACLEVQRIFVRMLEDGYVEDASGKKIDFTNTTIIFKCDTKDNASSVGFRRKNEEDLSFVPKSLVNNVFVKINMEPLNKESKNNIINNKINEIINSYPDINVLVKNSYKKKLYKKIEENEKLTSVILELQRNLEKKIVEGLISYKNIIEITDEVLSDVKN